MTLYNLVRAYTYTLGTVDLVVEGAVAGYLDFSVVTDGHTVSYGIREGDTTEVGRGVWSSATNTLTRDTVLSSTNHGNKISLLGSAQVYITALAEDIVAGVTDHSALSNLTYALSGHTGFEPTISILSPAKGGTGVNNGLFNLTVPATMTAAGLERANVFTAIQKINVNSAAAQIVEQTGVKNNVWVVDTTNARVGTGRAPTAELDIYKNQNAATKFIVTNEQDSGAVTAVRTEFDLFTDGGRYIKFYLFGAGYTTSGIFTPYRGVLDCNGTAGMYLATSSSGAGANFAVLTGGLSATANARIFIGPTGLMHLGNTGGIVGTSQVKISGGSDIVTLEIKAHSTQTANDFEMQDSSNAISNKFCTAYATTLKETVFNEQGSAYLDLRAESDTEPNMIFLDASADTIRLGGTTNSIQVAKGGTLSMIGTAGIQMPHMMQSDSTDQTIANVANAQVITFDTDVHHYDITRTSSSRFTITRAGSYLITFSGMVSGVATKLLQFWLRVNGNDVANSNTSYQFKGTGTSAVVACSFIQHFNATDYFEFWTWGDDVGCKWDAIAAGSTPTRPAVPSVIMTCNYVGVD